LWDEILDPKDHHFWILQQLGDMIPYIQQITRVLIAEMNTTLLTPHHPSTTRQTFSSACAEENQGLLRAQI